MGQTDITRLGGGQATASGHVAAGKEMDSRSQEKIEGGGKKMRMRMQGRSEATKRKRG